MYFLLVKLVVPYVQIQHLVLTFLFDLRTRLSEMWVSSTSWIKSTNASSQIPIHVNGHCGTMSDACSHEQFNMSSTRMALHWLLLVFQDSEPKGVVLDALLLAAFASCKALPCKPYRLYFFPAAAILFLQGYSLSLLVLHNTERIKVQCTMADKSKCSVTLLSILPLMYDGKFSICRVRLG